jgi:pyruvate/2-oxoglutarate dehydrogenase complex dihydrolipoamide acyltransferase (E2) component
VIERGAAAVEGQECGNGLVIDHGGGLSTQYCHMARGSVVVSPGDRVEAGATLGRVGLSGQTEYPHLHFTARQDNRVIEPFLPAGGATPAACGTGGSMWRADAAAHMAYRPRVVLNAGFSDAPVTMEAIEAATAPAARADSPALVAYVRALGLQIGDVDQLVVTGPDGSVVVENTGRALASNRAQQMIFAGRRSRAGGWPPGVYEAVYTVRAEGRVVFEERFSLAL